MKKFTLIFSMLIACVCFNAKAQEEDLAVYVTGVFNNNEISDDWKLSFDEDAAEEGRLIFRGMFYIPEGQFQFNFSYGFMKLVPGISDGEEIVWSSRSVNVFDDDTSFSGLFGYTSMANSWWINEDWSGGDVQMVVDIDNQELTLSMDEAVEDVWYIRGAFNNYNPDGQSQWALTAVTDGEVNGLYSGTFNVPAGELSFNLLNPYGVIYIPYEIDVVEMEFVDNVYTGLIDYYLYEGDEFLYWKYSEWEGGSVTVTINLDESTITVVLNKTNSVSAAVAAETNTAIYNLNGQRVDPDRLGKGIYIVNGKKVVM